MKNFKFKGVHPQTNTIMDVVVLDWVHDQVYFDQDTDVPYSSNECQLMLFTGKYDEDSNALYQGSEGVRHITKYNEFAPEPTYKYRGLFLI
jgi:hypothetical protein